MNIEHAIDAYIEAALWSSTDGNGNSLDNNYTRDDLAPETLAAMRADVTAFVIANAEDISLWDGPTDPEVQAGHDLWLTRNGYGCGFWESEWTDLETDPGSRLDSAAKSLEEVTLYIGDNGTIYAA